jgi:hypothetical protein
MRLAMSQCNEPWRGKPEGGNRIHNGVTANVDLKLPYGVQSLEGEGFGVQL